VRGQRHAPAAYYPQERPGTHCTGGWVGLISGVKLTKISLYSGKHDMFSGFFSQLTVVSFITIMLQLLLTWFQYGQTFTVFI